MSLSDILEPEFFTECLKKGNVLMISEGRREIDNLYSLREGVLRIELDKATYERCGLAGRPISDGGRKHIRSRFEIEINLRLPSMLHGKAGFDRLVRAAREVLNHSISWLFYDLSNATDPPAPILRHHPLSREIRRQTFPKQRVSCIDVCSLSVESLCEPPNAAGIYEWLGMISLDSPRVDRLDKVDPYLSRYEIPNCVDAADGGPEASGAPSRLLMRVIWHGLLPSQVLTRIWLMVRDSVGNDWAAMSVGCFGNKAYTALEVGRNGTLVWEVEDRTG